MKRFTNLLVFPVVVVGLLLAGASARADTITISLDSQYQSGPGSVFTFFGTLTNTGSDTVYLNGYTPVLDAGLVLDGNPFFANAPLSLDPGQSTADIELFTITVPPYGLGSNFYAGTFEILGGGPSDDSLLGSADFNINVTPEPTSLVLLLTGMAGLAGALRRKLIG